MSQGKRKMSDGLHAKQQLNLKNNWLLKKKKVQYDDFKLVAKGLFKDAGGGKLALLDEKTFEYAAVSYFWENEYAEGEKRQEFTRTMRIFVQTKKDRRISIQKVIDIVGVKGLSEWHLDKDSIDKPINAVEANFATIGNCQKHHKAGVLRIKGAKGNAKKEELEVDTASAGEGETISSFDTDTPPSLNTDKKRKKCSQFSLTKSPSKQSANKPSKHRNPNKKEDDNIDEIKYSKKQRSSQAAYESTKAHLSNSDEDNHKGNIDIKKLSVATSNNNTSRATAATGNVTETALTLTNDDIANKIKEISEQTGLGTQETFAQFWQLFLSAKQPPGVTRSGQQVEQGERIVNTDTPLKNAGNENERYKHEDDEEEAT